jgi:hypothetical protein
LAAGVVNQATMAALRLSIVIPALGKLDRLENSLLSVLENRPPLCEVLVVVNDQYDDPYSLEGEVRFVAARYGASAVECVNVGIAASRGAVIHVLGCGATVTEGWAEPALVHFADPHVGAVAPLVLAHQAWETVWAAGVGYSMGGKRQLCLHGQPRAAIEASACPALGPTLSAAFYRKAALEELGELFCAPLGEMADVDLALRLQNAGWLAAFEPACLVVAEPPEAGVSRWRQALHAERLFWRHFGLENRLGELVAHAGVILSDTLRMLPHPVFLVAVAARLVGFCQRGKYRVGRQTDLPGSESAFKSDEAPLHHASAPAGRASVWHRVDAAHGLPAPQEKPSHSSRPRTTLTRSGLRYCRGD